MVQESTELSDVIVPIVLRERGKQLVLLSLGGKGLILEPSEFTPVLFYIRRRFKSFPAYRIGHFSIISKFRKSSIAYKIVFADVQWWDPFDVSVLCPFCGETIITASEWAIRANIGLYIFIKILGTRHTSSSTYFHNLLGILHMRSTRKIQDT